MAGHSKFKNIMHRKGAQDAKRGKTFTKVQREITVAAKMGGTDASSNPRLRSAMIAARAVNMPNDRIKRAIESAAGAGGSSAYFEMRYEGYGPGGVAIIVDALTDNRNRTAGEVRMAFSKYGGNLGETNSVSFMFDRVGCIVYPLSVADADTMFEASVEAGADDCQTGEAHEIYTSPAELIAVRDALEARFGEAESAALLWKPNVGAAVDEDMARSVMKMIDVLEDNDDVQHVTTNFEVSDEILERLAAG